MTYCAECFGTSGLTGSVRSGHQTAGRSISPTHSTHISHFPRMQQAVTAKQLKRDEQQRSTGGTLNLLPGARGWTLPDTCLSNKQLWSQMEVDWPTRSGFHLQTEHHGSPGSSLRPTGTGACTAPPLVVVNGGPGEEWIDKGSDLFLWLSLSPPWVNPTAGIQV